jgi:parallel beta helix pectate lyase-like protein
MSCGYIVRSFGLAVTTVRYHRITNPRAKHTNAAVVSLGIALVVAGSGVACGSVSGAATLRSPARLVGNFRLGHVVSVAGGRRDGAVAYRYRWERCNLRGRACVRVGRARTYRLGGRDLGSRLRAVVTAVAGGHTHSARTTPSAPVTVRPVASPCSGIDVDPGADVAAVVGGAAPGTTFCLRSGRYHVTRTIAPAEGDRLIGQPGTILDAGIALHGWSPFGGAWVAPAPTTVPTLNLGGGYGGSYKYGQAVFADDVFQDDRPLRKIGVEHGGRIIGEGPAQLRPGDYFYDYDHGRIYLGADPTGTRVELESLPDGVIHSVAGHVTISGLTVQGSVADGIVTGSGRVWTVVGNNVRLNHSEGVRVTTGGRVVRNYIHDNGTYGIAATGDGMRVTANEVAGNNTARYYRADGQCSDAGGSKITLSQDVVLNRNWYHQNRCIGIWFDIDNRGISILHNHVDGNYENGIDVEISYNALVRGNEVSGSSHWGIVDSASPHVIIAGNTVAGNGDGAIVLNQNARTDSPSPYGPHYARHILVTGNRIRMRAGRTGARQEGVAGTPFAGVVFAASNRFDRNAYVLPRLGRRWFEWAGGPRTIAAWQAAGQDAHSTFTRG